MKKIICLILFVFCLSSFAFAAEQDPILAKMQKNYADMNSFQAPFAQELFHRESQNTQKRSGEILFQKPFLLYWDTQKPIGELLAVTDKEIWTYFPEEELAYRYSLALLQDSKSMISFITGQSSLDTDFEVEKLADEQAEGKNLKHFMLYPFKPTVDFTQAELWVDEKTALISSIKITDFYGNTNKVNLGTMSINAKTEEGKFRFTPPEGTTIEDHTNEDTLSVNKLTQ